MLQANKLLKPFGELVTKLKPRKLANKQEDKKIILTWQEKSELITETIITVILLMLLNIAMLVILKQMVKTNPSLNNMIFGIKKVVWDNFQVSFFLSWQYIFIVILIAVDIAITVWRIRRRYKQFQLWHIISELHYIADGHYDHLVKFQLNGNLKDIIDSINDLVASTRQAIQEEQLIKKSKDELITNVSHDIRTPLTSIIGYLQLITAGQYTSEEEAKNYVQIAYDKAKEMKIMVDDLFEYSVLDQPTTGLKLDTFNLEELIQQVSVNYLLQMERANIQFTYHVEPSPLYMAGDADKIVRIFSNLLSNALKYGHGASLIAINARKIQDNVEIIVQNNGTPIPKESLSKIFERFYRGDASRNQAIKGTGLGLAIVHSIVKLHHGTINVESNHERTKFIITLPLNLNERTS